MENMMGQATVAKTVNEANQGGNANAAAQYYMEEREKGIVDVQLEVDTIKSDIYHLLSQDKLEVLDGGKVDWVPIKNQQQRTLSVWGVDRIMQVIHFYINKSNLLSNFSEEQINRLMLRFVKELNDLVLLKYQVLFRETTFDEAKIIILDKIESKKKMKLFALEIIEKTPSKDEEGEIERKLLVELEKTLEAEMIKVREEQRKEKIRDYGLLMAQLEVIVFGALNRAYKGEERGSIRRHTSITELIGPRPQQAPRQQGGALSWGK